MTEEQNHPMNPMLTPTFPERPGTLVGSTIWVLQIHRSNRMPVWNGPLPDEFAADALIEHVMGMLTKTEEQLTEEGFSAQESIAIKDIAKLVKYRAEVTMMPINTMLPDEDPRPIGFQLPHHKEGI